MCCNVTLVRLTRHERPRHLPHRVTVPRSLSLTGASAQHTPSCCDRRRSASASLHARLAGAGAPNRSASTRSCRPAQHHSQGWLRRWCCSAKHPCCNPLRHAIHCWSHVWFPAPSARAHHPEPPGDPDFFARSITGRCFRTFYIFGGFVGFISTIAALRLEGRISFNPMLLPSCFCYCMLLLVSTTTTTTAANL